MIEDTRRADRGDEADAGYRSTPPIQKASAATPAHHLLSDGATGRHEVEPTVPYAVVPGPARDTIRFYHVLAVSTDIQGLWASCRFCLSNLVWVGDHFVVTPNPLYLNPSSELVLRYAKIIHVLVRWYDAKRLVAFLDLPAE